MMRHLPRTTLVLTSAFSLLVYGGCDSRSTIPNHVIDTPEPHASTPPKPDVHPLSLVRNEQATSAVIIADHADEVIRDTARRLIETVQRATGAELPLVSLSQEAELSNDLLRIYIGPSAATIAAGLKTTDLPDEGYRVVASERGIYLLGQERAATLSGARGGSRPTLWAVNYLLEHHLGVRWLWPGTSGTYVPRQKDFTIPAIDHRGQPKLMQRRLRMNLRANSQLVSSSELAHLNPQLIREAHEWVENHQSGRRGEIQFGHAFESWWENYGATHPDYFAETPAGITQPAYNYPGRVKLRLSNPDVIQQIVKEYEAAGAPEYWNVCPTDGTGFDISAATRAWDIPKDQSPEDIWHARGNLTARYVKFWNLLHAALAKVNPNVKLSTYAYHSFKTPPPPERPLTAKTAIGVVCGIFDYELWKGWAAQEGTEAMFLRPNWGHNGANAPLTPLRDTAQFLRFTWENKIRGLDVDSITGFWSTQGTNYYLWARMMTRKDLSLDEIINEYTSAFGAGASKIRSYIDYWQQRTDEFGYPSIYGNHQNNTDSPYYKLVKEGKTELNFVRGPRYALPHLYTDEVLKPAYRLLNEAEEAIGTSDPEARERVAFLRDGLREMALTRDAIALARQITAAKSHEDLEKFHRLSAELEAFRESITPRHVVWSVPITNYEDRRHVPMRPRNMKLPELNLDGL